MENKPNKLEVSFVFCDYTNEYHCKRFAELINHYMTDTMGVGKPLTAIQQLYLVDGMEKHPTSLVMFAVIADEIIGLVTCFVNFSTFKVKSYLYIHDIVVESKFRGKGVGRKLIEKCVDIARERKYCKVTLEVRDDNELAKKLYKSIGFKDTEPMMCFWTKEI